MTIKSFMNVASLLKSSVLAAFTFGLMACGGIGPSSPSSSSSVSSASSSSSSVVSSSSSVSSSVSSSSSSTGSVDSGRDLFAGKCANCHAVGQNGNFGTGSYGFNINSLKKTTLDGLADYISAQMPLGNPGSCVGSCALDITVYLKTFVSGSGSSSSVQGNLASSFIYDDFESGTNGAAPKGWGTILGHGQVDGPNNAGSSAYALIDSSRAHSGSKSVHIKSANASAPHFIYQSIPKGETTVYVRAWMYVPVTLGGGAAGSPGDHAHFLGTVERPGFDEKELRYGLVNKGTLGGFMPKPGDSFTKIPTSAKIPANTWTCVEWAVIDSSFDQMIGWVNGTEVFAAKAASDWQNTTPATFTGGGFTNYISFGWRMFGNVANVSDIWFDDIVVGTERIGCN